MKICYQLVGKYWFCPGGRLHYYTTIKQLFLINRLTDDSLKVSRIAHLQLCVAMLGHLYPNIVSICGNNYSNHG